MKYEVLVEFIRKYFPQRKDRILSNFRLYHQLLLEENQKVNLVSRKTSPENIWTLHFLDSILPAKLFKLANQTILDFGSGGGLPGIPLKIIFPEIKLYLLDSKLKKMKAVRKMIKILDLKSCFTVVSRLEYLDQKWHQNFDLIVCRSVKMTPKFKEKLFALLKNNGELILYKSKKLDDIDIFPEKSVFDISHSQIGERKIIRIKK